MLRARFRSVSERNWNTTKGPPVRPAAPCVFGKPVGDRVRLIEDSSQVLAYDLICNTADMDPEKLGRIANDASYLIAKLAANGSELSDRLGHMGQNQSLDGRLELLGDIAATVLMYEIGRRRGLFDALLTDFGSKRFCTGMRADMRTRYNDMVSDLAE